MGNKTDKEIVLESIKFLYGQKGHVNIVEDKFWDNLAEEKRLYIRDIMIKGGVINIAPYDPHNIVINETGIISKPKDFDSKGVYIDKQRKFRRFIFAIGLLPIIYAGLESIKRVIEFINWIKVYVCYCN